MGVHRVLVIEDEAAAREALESLLREEGYHVRSAPSGRSGLECHGEFQPDVIVCDYYLPDIDGLQVLRCVRQAGPASVRFIMVTAGLTGDDRERALRDEADAYLAKPINLADLNRALRTRDASADDGPVLNVTV